MAEATSTPEGIFESGENLQAAIGKALQDKKALLCFVYEEDDGQSDQWESALTDDSIKEKLLSSTVLLRLRAGTDQAGFLSGVCPIHKVPAIIIIHNAQVVANYQHGQTSFEDLQKELKSKYARSSDSERSSSGTDEIDHLDLPAPEGRMRLPNNAYDELRKVTEDYISKGITGKALLDIQLSIIGNLKIDLITNAVSSIRSSLHTSPKSALPDEVTDKLLTTPASKMQAAITSSTTSQSTTSSASASQTRDSEPARQPPPVQTPQSTQPTASSSRSTISDRPHDSAQSQTPPVSLPTTSTTSSHTSQRAQYIAAQKARESTQSAERERIKAQIAADKAVRREAEAQAAAEQRRIDLLNLRKANSTTLDPKASDVRIQVRLFDGSTIRNSFPAEATVAKDVRSWIDGEVAKKAANGGSPAGQPYNLKLILTPSPNRAIEAGEEDEAICDLDGIRGSATMVMVPVRGYVDSYSGSSGGVVGGVVSGATSMVGTGIGLVGSAAGLFVGGLGRLLGGGAASAQQPQHTTPEVPARDAGDVGSTSGGRQNMRVRTLADQRMDEEDDRRKKGAQLYNGMGLNVQPRKDDDDAEAK